MKKLRVLDLFSGIGGFSLGLDRAGGFETVAFCEIEPFPRRVLAKHWPEVPCYDDVTKLTGDILERDGITGIDVITGGFPCQDISVAGKQAGLGEGTRSGLWSEIVRLIGELAPRYVIVENVAALLSGPSQQRGGWFGSILGDLAECGYDAEWENIPAAAVGAPHRRERVWIVAYPNGTGHNRKKKSSVYSASHGKGFADNAGYESGKANVADADHERLQGGAQAGNPSSIRAGGHQFLERCAYLSRAAWEPEPDVGRVANGVPKRVDRLKGLGNAVVPQIPELIGRAIMEAEGMI
jgi:DNA (cytosine-5)-methyltransferase 1